MPHPLDLSFKKWAWEQLMHARLERYQDDENYYNGSEETRADIPQYIKDALDSDYGMKLNFAHTVVNAYASAIAANPIAVEALDLKEAEDGEKSQVAINAEAGLVDLYERSGFAGNGANFVKAARILGKKGNVALKIFRREDNGPIFINVIRPDIVAPKFFDDDQDELEYVAIILSRVDDNNKPFKWAQVFYNDGDVATFRTMGMITVKTMGVSMSIDDWIEIERNENDLAVSKEPNRLNIPIVWIENFIDDHNFTVSDIEPHKDLLDQINKTITDLALISHKAGQKRVFVLGEIDAEALNKTPPKKTPGGLSAIAGSKDMKIMVVDEDNVAGQLSRLKDLVTHLAVNTGIKDLSPELTTGQLPSGRALWIFLKRFQARVNEKMKVISDGLETLNKIWLAANNIQGVTTKIHIVPEMPDDMDEDSKVAALLVEMGIWSKERGMRHTGVEDVAAEKELIQKEQSEMGDPIPPLADAAISNS